MNDKFGLEVSEFEVNSIALEHAVSIFRTINKETNSTLMRNKLTPEITNEIIDCAKDFRKFLKSK